MSLQDFRDLGNGTLVYDPPLHGFKPDEHCGLENSEDRPREAEQPTLILLCSWLGGATAKRIEKYTLGYHNLWPNSPILLIRTNAAEYACWPVKSLRAKLGPAQREIRRLLSERRINCQMGLKANSQTESEDLGILLHMFSNGGANVATHLVIAMNNILGVLAQAKPLPLRQIVFDSCPGDLAINTTYVAASYSFSPTHPLRPLICAVLYLVVASIAGLEIVGLRKPLAKTLCDQLNNPSIFSSKAHRLYLTSKADVIVSSMDVQTHRDQALAGGLKTETVVFEKARHCCLVLEDEATYWNAIASTWDNGGYYDSASCVKLSGWPRDDGTCMGSRNSRRTTVRTRSRL